MISPTQFIDHLEKNHIDFFTGVPDSLLKEICACMTARFDSRKHLIATNEGSAIGLAIGHYLATEKPALVYMQNSGLGNAVNPLASLATPEIYGIPMLLMIGWRGELDDESNQLHDEPQHVLQGKITIPQLALLGIPHEVISSDSINYQEKIDDLLDLAQKESRPVALVIKKNTFEKFALDIQASTWSLTREKAIEIIASSSPKNAPVISTTGMASRELFEIRKAKQEDHGKDFLTVGGMGHALQIATGIALAHPQRPVICVDGDGALLMHSGGQAISAGCHNLLHIVINNEAHDSVGGQPTRAGQINLLQIASGFGYEHVETATDEASLIESLQQMYCKTGSRFLEIKCRKGGRSDLGRPDRSPSQNKKDFMVFLGSR